MRAANLELDDDERVPVDKLARCLCGIIGRYFDRDTLEEASGELPGILLHSSNADYDTNRAQLLEHLSAVQSALDLD